jgi:hypothetical protein
MRRQRINRTTPAVPARAYKTFAIASPVETHTRPASCAEVGCHRLADGFQVVVDEATELGQRQAHYLRADGVPAHLAASYAARGARRYTESRTPEGLTAFAYPPGTRCFEEHLVPLERPELYIVRGGDWRGNPTGEVRRHSGPDPWLNDFGEHQDRIAKVRS